MLVMSVHRLFQAALVCTPILLLSPVGTAQASGNFNVRTVKAAAKTTRSATRPSLRSKFGGMVVGAKTSLARLFVKPLTRGAAAPAVLAHSEPVVVDVETANAQPAAAAPTSWLGRIGAFLANPLGRGEWYDRQAQEKYMQGVEYERAVQAAHFRQLQ